MSRRRFWTRQGFQEEIHRDSQKPGFHNTNPNGEKKLKAAALQAVILEAMKNPDFHIANHRIDWEVYGIRDETRQGVVLGADTVIDLRSASLEHASSFAELTGAMDDALVLAVSGIHAAAESSITTNSP